MSTSALPYIGRKISLVSNSELRLGFPYLSITLTDEALKVQMAVSLMVLLKLSCLPFLDYVSIDEIRIKANHSKAVNRVSLLFGEHSRELIGPETGLMLLPKMLCGHKHANSTLAAEALEDSEFQLILNANPGSRVREYCLRENPNGVDLNRNWDEKWDLGSEISVDQAHGKRPFSEPLGTVEGPETQVVRDLISDFKPTTFLSELDEAHCKCPFGAAGKEVGYDCPGTSFDWVFDHLKVPFSFAWEIYADPASGENLRKRWEEKIASTKVSLLQSNALSDFYAETPSDLWDSMEATNQRNCFSIFNPGTEEEYNATVLNWARSYLNLAIKTAPLV
eukprot:Skav201971  [mRNA]  locus=scaffold103:289916:294990:+ [translate_table: standard]